MKKNIFILGLAATFLLPLTFEVLSAEKIKLYSFYTPSHKVFLDEWFLPSLQDDFDVVLECWDQDCVNGQYGAQGWITTMLHKVDLIIRGIKENWHKIFIHSDVDIQFFAPIKDMLLDLMHEDMDMLIQRDSPAGCACAGFFVCRGNQKTLNLWQEIRRRLSDEQHIKLNPETNDQEELNILLNATNYSEKDGESLAISWDLLPKEFLSGGTLTGERWNPGRSLYIPENILLHHANWTIGIENKIEQLRYVRSLVDAHFQFKRAQECEEKNEYHRACQYYKVRTRLCGDEEEDFLALYKYSLLMEELEEFQWSDVLHGYLQAYAKRPKRAEPLVKIAQHYFELDNKPLCFMFARESLAIPYPKDEKLFVDKRLYDYTRYDLLGVVAWYLGEFDLGEYALTKVLEAYPEDGRLKNNLAFYTKRRRSIALL